MPDVLGVTLTNDIWIAVKIMAIVGLSIYIIFAFVIVRQVNLMIATLKVGFETPIRIFSLIHLFASIGLLILSILIL